MVAQARSHRALTAHSLALLASGLSLTGALLACGSDRPDITYVAGGPGDGSSGLDVREHPAWGTLGEGAIALPGHLEVQAPPGAVPLGVEVGLRPSPRKLAVPAGFEALTPWVELASNRADVRAAPDAPIALRFPLADPTLADAPGLLVVAALPNGVITLDGRHETDAAGAHHLVVDAPGLPSRVDLCLARNPAWLRLESADLDDDAPTPRSGSDGWSTVEWTLVFDGGKISLAQARDTLRWAREAARFYAGLGLREPFLYRDRMLGLERWHIHIAPSDSHYDSNSDPTAAELARRFGRIQMGADDLARPPEHALGGGLAIVAHEIFHAVFEAYVIPKTCFNRTRDGVTYCYPSSEGFNEGFASALGYHVETRALAVLPGVGPTTLEQPLGDFDPDNTHLAYQNQDAFVFYFRLGQPGFVRPVLEALAGAAMPLAEQVRFPSDALVPYGLALDQASLTVPSTLSELHHLYVVERGYVRTELGWLWPSEPIPEEPGASNMYAPDLFPNAWTMEAGNCEIDESEAKCQVTFPDMPPLSAHAVLVDLQSGELLPRGFAGEQGAEVRFEVESTDDDGQPAGKVAFTVFGERYGEGHDEGRVGSADGGAVTLKEVGSRWTNLRVFVVRGAGPVSTVTLTMTIALGGLSPICRQYRDIYCACVVEDVQPLEQCRVQFTASLEVICDPVGGHLPEDMTCDGYCADQVTRLSPSCDTP